MPPYVEFWLWVVAIGPDKGDGLKFARVLAKREHGGACLAVIDSRRETPENGPGLELLGYVRSTTRLSECEPWTTDAEEAGIGETKEQALLWLMQRYQYRIQGNLDEVATWQKRRQAAATLLQELSEPAGVVV